MLRLSPMAKENEQYQQKRLTSFLCFSKSLIFFSYTSTSQGLAGVFSAAFPVWGQHKTFPNPQHTCFCLKPHQEGLLYSFIVKAFIIRAIFKEHFSFFFLFYIKKYSMLSNEIWTTYLLWRVDLHLGSDGGGLLLHRLLFGFGSFSVRLCCRWSCHWRSPRHQFLKFLILQSATIKKKENESVYVTHPFQWFFPRWL